MSSPPAPTQYTTTTRTLSPTQQGVQFLTGGIWNGAVIYAHFPNGGFLNNILGLRFQLYSSMVLLKPVIKMLTLDLEAGVWVGMPTSPTWVSVAIQDIPDSAVFDNTNLPPRQDVALPANWYAFGYDDGTSWTNPTTPTTISIPLGVQTTDPVLGTTVYTYNSFSDVFEHSDSNGMINLSVHIYTDFSAAEITPTLRIEEASFHTGMMVGEGDLKRRTRVVHSYKSGFPYLADEAVPDGFTDGIMMHPDDYDPEDPVDQGRGDYVPSPGEGVVDDEVTDLEG